jgi:hypothetical protein
VGGAVVVSQRETQPRAKDTTMTNDKNRDDDDQGNGNKGESLDPFPMKRLVIFGGLAVVLLIVAVVMM